MTTPRRLALLLPLLMTACPLPATSPDGGGGGAGGGGENTGGGGGSSATGGGTAIGADGGALVAPELTSATAQVSGRTGKDLRVGIVGKDRNVDIVGARLQLVDLAGNVVLDGAQHPVEVALTFDTRRWVGETLTASGSARGLFNGYQGIGQVIVKLVDASSLLSTEQTATVTEQAIRALGESCDTTFVANRCAPSFGCRGSPATCQEGLAPTIARMAFFRNAAGPMILLEGVEPEDDLSTIKFEFQNAQGATIEIDSDGNDVPDLSQFDLDAQGTAVDGTYFIRLQAGVGLDTQVPFLVAKATDSAGHQSAVKKVAPSNPPVRAAGQTCDPRGFDVCGANLACSPGVVGATNKCTSAATLHTAECAGAPVLVVTTAGASVVGQADGVSLYDAPLGCSSNDPRDRPEGLVTVRLPTRANSLTLTTARPGTTFDTTMYVLTGCPIDASEALLCADDGANSSASTLTLTDLPAGDYQVVIDSFGYAGGTFELHAIMD